MNDNTKIEVAKEVIYEIIGNAVMKENLTTNDKKLVDLLNLKNEVNKGNMEAIDFVLKNYKLEEKKGV